MGSPTIPVPGIPTPMAFFNILALNRTSIFSGFAPSVSAALATQSATAIGSVHPIAGITSLVNQIYNLSFYDSIHTDSLYLELDS